MKMLWKRDGCLQESTMGGLMGCLHLMFMMLFDVQIIFALICID